MVTPSPKYDRVMGKENYIGNKINVKYEFQRENTVMMQNQQ